MPRSLRLVALWSFFVVFVACGAPSHGDEESVGSTDSALVTATGVDYSFARPSPAGLHADGYTFAARYLSHDPPKDLTKGEADALWANKVDVVANWEATAGGALNGHAQGVADAQAAEAEAKAAGMPAGRPIYFSVDFDATPGQQAALNAYFDGVGSVIGVTRAGAYGGYYVIQRLFDAGKIKWGWQTYAWSGGQWEPRAQLRQVQNGITAAGDGACCDKDQAVAADFGQWHAAPADLAPRGAFDSAACAGLAGWSQDQNAPTTANGVELSFNAAAGAAGSEAVRLVASVNRKDLCTPLGSCDHGFTFEMPLGVQDGKPHAVHAYGIDTAGGPSTELTGSPKSLQCPYATPPLDATGGIKRHVLDAAAMKAWGFSSLLDVAPQPDAVLTGFAAGADWTEKPALIQADDGSPSVWLLDGNIRRHVVSGASLAAWHRTFAEVVKTPAAKVNAYAQGPDLPTKPFLMIGSGPAVYVLDADPSTPPGPVDPDAGAPGGPGTPGTPGAPGSGGPSASPDPGNADGAHSSGCSAHGRAPATDLGWMLGLAVALATLGRRRRAV